MNFEKQSFKFLKRNREIDILNEDREIPKVKNYILSSLSKLIIVLLNFIIFVVMLITNY